MSTPFSAEAMNQFKNLWNSDAALTAELSSAGFNSKIGYGLIGDVAPSGVIHVEAGYVTYAGAFAGEELDWDLRADEETWGEWFVKSPSLMGLGLAYTSRKLKFVKGDYATMVKDPRLAGPFVRSFELLSKVS